MNKNFSKEDSQRLRKLENALISLKDGSKTYFSITKISSIKSLCKDQDVLRQFCIYLSVQVLKEPGRLPIKYAKKKVKTIVSDIANNPSEPEMGSQSIFWAFSNSGLSLR